MPSPDFETIKYFFDKGLGLPLQKFESVHTTPCTDDQFANMPDIEVGLNGHLVTIPKESWILKLDSKCYIMIQVMNQSAG